MTRFGIYKIITVAMAVVTIDDVKATAKDLAVVVVGAAVVAVDELVALGVVVVKAAVDDGLDVVVGTGVAEEVVGVSVALPPGLVVGAAVVVPVGKDPAVVFALTQPLKSCVASDFNGTPQNVHVELLMAVEMAWKSDWHDESAATVATLDADGTVAMSEKKASAEKPVEAWQDEPNAAIALEIGSKSADVQEFAATEAPKSTTQSPDTNLTKFMNASEKMKSMDCSHTAQHVTRHFSPMPIASVDLHDAVKRFLKALPMVPLTCRQFVALSMEFAMKISQVRR
ncbi:hypothetical protein LEN26_014017 [Aphanomyces euteiches]|nr:hypothetical protein AeMF1_021195 [Aphanomyces euteiches]KAH9109496.1 hypothetical protein LEN26_014017 [Aphanomyces euteiches]KAH9187360.1 hypothetical protein AeNC1_010662 [Aphanomyces euteiches]